jgi:hypothetical protein
MDKVLNRLGTVRINSLVTFGSLGRTFTGSVLIELTCHKFNTAAWRANASGFGWSTVVAKPVARESTAVAW